MVVSSFDVVLLSAKGERVSQNPLNHSNDKILIVVVSVVFKVGVIYMVI